MLPTSGLRWPWSRIDCTIFKLSAYTSVRCQSRSLTKRFKSSPLTSDFTLTIFRSILAIKSSRKITISWLKNLMRHGLVPKCTFGILILSRPVSVERRGLRGNVELTVISSGPGMNTKWVVLVMRGYAVIKSARASKFSVKEKTEQKSFKLVWNTHLGIFERLVHYRALSTCW